MYPLLVLNLQAYRILSDVDRVKNNSVRFLFWLMTAYDLVSGFKALSLPAILAERPDLQAYQVKHYVGHLVACGILEQGPLTRTWALNTYRINPAMLLSADDLREFFRETKARAERESLLPKKTSV